MEIDDKERKFHPSTLAERHEAISSFGIDPRTIKVKFNDKQPASVLSIFGKHYVNFHNNDDPHWGKFVAYHEMGHIKDERQRKFDVVALPAFLKFCFSLSLIYVGGEIMQLFLALRKFSSQSTPIRDYLIIAATIVGVAVSLKKFSEKLHQEVYNSEHRANVLAVDVMLCKGYATEIFFIMVSFWANRKIHPPLLEKYLHLKDHLAKKTQTFLPWKSVRKLSSRHARHLPVLMRKKLNIILFKETNHTIQMLT